MIRVFHKAGSNSWYYEWPDKKGVTQRRGPWKTEKIAAVEVKKALGSGLIEIPANKFWTAFWQQVENYAYYS